jgi:hypothetical protein
MTWLYLETEWRWLRQTRDCAASARALAGAKNAQYPQVIYGVLGLYPFKYVR